MGIEAGHCGHLSEWLWNSAPWRYHEGSFFRQLECDLLATPLPEACQPIVDPRCLQDLRERVAGVFGTPLAGRLSIVGHKLLPGYEIGLHNDAPDPGMETHRLVVHLSSPDARPRGGDLLLFGSRSEADIVARPEAGHNVGVAFALSDRSYHAVTRIESGARYSVVFSFWSIASDTAARLREESLNPVAMAGLVKVLRALGAEAVEHSGRTLLEHLQGTCELLRAWCAPPHVCIAGLFHSVYGTPTFSDALVSPAERALLRRALPARAEELAFLFGHAERTSLYRPGAPVESTTVPLRGSDETVSIDSLTRRELLLIDAANYLEQARHAPSGVDEVSRRVLLGVSDLLPEAARRALAESCAE